MSRPKRRLGQHFLSDPRILARIADALGAMPADTVLEIGPGKGALTGELLQRAGRVTAIEKDATLVPLLRERFPALILAEGDALELDWPALLGDPPAADGARLVAGNIPYNITSPLIDKALMPPRPARVVFLVQKEVADRVAAGPAHAAYGALSVGVQAVARAERLFTVPAGAFYPPPEVDSAVLRLTPLAEPLIRDEEAASFRRFVVGLFAYRRKQLLRGLRELSGWSPERLGPLLEASALDPALRCETLAPATFAVLHRAMRSAGWSPE